MDSSDSVKDKLGMSIYFEIVWCVKNVHIVNGWTI